MSNQENVETNETPVTEQVQLTVQDLQLLANIVDLASRRGAFQAAELSQVGEAYNKLASFLNYVDDVRKKENPESEVESEPKPADAV